MGHNKIKKVFISHSSVDKYFVRKLKRDLNLNDIQTWLDEDEMFPGDSLTEKLDKGLKDSTHFIIILSKNSIESEWVEYELENALIQVEEATIKKIIPIKYRDCIIPESLQKLIYVNLSKETVYIKNGWLEFQGENYSVELDKVVKSIKISTSPLTENEKDDLSSIIPNIIDINNDEIILHLMVAGYKSISKFINTYIPKEIIKSIPHQQLEDIQPIVLPYFLKEYFPSIKFGDNIEILNKNEEKISGNFAKFSKNNNRIIIPKKIRNYLGIENKSSYKVKVDFDLYEFKLIKILDE